MGHKINKTKIMSQNIQTLCGSRNNRCELTAHNILYLHGIKLHSLVNFSRKLQEHVDETDKKRGLVCGGVTCEPLEEYHEDQVTDETLQEDHLWQKCAIYVESFALEPENIG